MQLPIIPVNVANLQHSVLYWVRMPCDRLPQIPPEICIKLASKPKTLEDF
jgi:hypothetical protein